MKKFLSILIALILSVSLVACKEDAGNSNSVNDDKSSSISEQESKPNVDDSSSKIDSSSSVESESKEPVKNVADYDNVPFDEWVYWSDKGDFATALSNINGVPYGTAGSSLDLAAASVEMIALSENDKSLEAIKSFMGNMTDTQKDYFTFSWAVVYSNTEGIFNDFANAKGLLDSAGFEEFDISKHSKEKLDKLNENVNKLFDEMGITREWKNHKDVEPFINVMI